MAEFGREKDNTVIAIGNAGQALTSTPGASRATVIDCLKTA
jgi:hypothetical protein